MVVCHSQRRKLKISIRMDRPTYKKRSMPIVFFDYYYLWKVFSRNDIFPSIFRGNRISEVTSWSSPSRSCFLVTSAEPRPPRYIFSTFSLSIFGPRTVFDILSAHQKDMRLYSAVKSHSVFSFAYMLLQPPINKLYVLTSCMNDISSHQELIIFFRAPKIQCHMNRPLKGAEKRRYILPYGSFLIHSNSTRL